MMNDCIICRKPGACEWGQICDQRGRLEFKNDENKCIFIS